MYNYTQTVYVCVDTSQCTLIIVYKYIYSRYVLFWVEICCHQSPGTIMYIYLFIQLPDQLFVKKQTGLHHSSKISAQSVEHQRNGCGVVLSHRICEDKLTNDIDVNLLNLPIKKLFSFSKGPLTILFDNLFTAVLTKSLSVMLLI